MRLIPYLLFSVLLLVGCASSRPTGDSSCDCNTPVRVPDPAFRSWLVDNGYATKAGARRLQPTPKGCSVTILACFNQGIRSLEGIEMFPQLKHVTCSENPISRLDLNALPNLQSLYCYDVPLRQLDISRCHHLRTLEFSNTRLDTLDLSTLPELTSLLCIFSPLRALDLSSCPLLTTLYIRMTHIRVLDLRSCPAFHELHALDTPLGRIIVTPGQAHGDIQISVEDSVRVVVRQTQ